MDKAQCKMESAALVLGSIFVAALVYFAWVASVWIVSDSCDVGLTIGFMKTVKWNKM